MSIWLIESSYDGGKTWRVEQSYSFYKIKEHAEQRIERQLDFYRVLGPASIHYGAQLRLVEYVPKAE